MNLQTLVWAVDILGEDKALQQKSGKMVRLLAEATSARTTPVFIMSPNPFAALAASSAETLEDNEGNTRLDMKKKADKWVQPFAVPNIASSEVLLSPDLSLRSAVDALLHFATGRQADLIVVSTQARKGATRFLMGSFAETLMLRTTVPLLLVQPKTVLPKKFKTIIFPTDFSEKSQIALDEVIVFAKAIGATIELFHHLEYMTPITMNELASVKAYQQLLKEEKKQRTAKGKKWVESIKSKGVGVKFTLNEKGTYTVDAILQFSKKFPSGILAMASQSEPGLAQVLGSIVRRLVRSAECPVWLVHPRAQIGAKKNSARGSSREKRVQI